MITSGQSLRDVFVARQPILDAEQSVYGYEVLFRSSTENLAVIEDPNQATSELLLNAFVEIGLDTIVGDKKAFLNLTREFLIGQSPLPLEADRLVLEILEDVVIDEELIAGVSALVDRGYTLALDDVAYHDRLQPLLGIAKIVKVDLPKVPAGDLAQHVASFRRFPVRLLAEKVETQEEFKSCESLGFELFQGFFLSRPQMMQSRQPRASQKAVLQLLLRLSDPDVSIDEVERLVSSDPALTYKMLRYVNSSKFSPRRKIESLRQVIVLLGVHEVRTLAMLVSLAGVSRKPAELLANAMIRALLCERLGKLRHYRDPDAFFTAGLLSSLDAVLDLPLPEVMNTLNLTDELRDAVLNHVGPVGQAVTTAIAHEHGDFAEMGYPNVEPSDVRSAYLAAIGEARSLWSELED